MKKSIFIPIVTILHALLTAGTMLLLFSIGMRRFDTGDSQGVDEKVLEILFNILSLPIYYLIVNWTPKSAHSIFPGLLGYIPLILNSLLWSIGLWCLYALWKRRKEAQIKG
jgi:hypothetical protein